MVQTSTGKVRTPVNIPISLVLKLLFVKRRHGLSLYFTVLLKFAVHENFSINKLVKLEWFLYTWQKCYNYINRLFKKHTQTPQNNNNETLEDIRPKIWIRLPYLGNHGKNLVRTLLKKIQRCLKQPINFIVIYRLTPRKYHILSQTKTAFLIFLEATLCTNSLVRAVIQNISAKLIDVFLHDSPNMASLIALILITITVAAPFPNTYRNVNMLNT